MLVIVPPQAYDQIVEALGYPGGFVDFYLKHYFAFGTQFCPNPCIVLPTWNHLWFVVYLWVYTMALGVVVMVAPAWSAGSSAGLRRLCPARGCWSCRRWPLRPTGSCCSRTFPRRMRCSATGTITRCLRRCSCSASCSRIRKAVLACRRAAALDRVVARGRVLPVLHLAAHRCGTAECRSRIISAWPTAAINGFAWSPCSALRAAGSTKDSAARRYLTDAIFPYYIVHQTAIIMIAHALRGSGLSAWAEAAS